MDSPRVARPLPTCMPLDPVPSVVYGITAVRCEAGALAEVMMGLIDRSLSHWESRPAPTRLVEVVDRLVEGDAVVTLFPTETGTLRLGAEVKVDVLQGGVETLASTDEQPGQRLLDLPRY